MFILLVQKEQPREAILKLDFHQKGLRSSVKKHNECRPKKKKNKHLQTNKTNPKHPEKLGFPSTITCTFKLSKLD